MRLEPLATVRAFEPAANVGVIVEALDIDEGALTQDGIARVFARRYKDRLRFCHHTGAWYEWAGTSWQRDDTQLAFEFVREIAREFSEASKPGELKELRRFTFAAGVERFSRGDRTFATRSDFWDRDPYLLGTPGGTVELRTGDLRPSSPTDGITKLTAVAPADVANCPQWLRFLEEATRGDQAYIRFLQQWSGYSLTGDTSEQSLCFAYGGGGNGKGVLIHTLSGIMRDYAMAAAMETFTASKYDRHPTEIASLRGARLVTASETEEGRQWAEARIKQLTGGDTMRARYMRMDEFEFVPVLKLLIIGNNKPSLSSVDDAARRRFNLLPFLHKPAAPDLNLERKLEAEWPAILRWMIDGCLDWQEHGLVRPDVVQVATAEYFAAQDTIGDWLEAKCIADQANPFRKASTAELHESWAAYARQSNEPAGTMKSFSQIIEKRGFTPVKHVPTATGNRVRGFTGIELRRDASRDHNYD